MSGKRYQSGYDDGFKAGEWAGRRDALRLVRELRDWIVGRVGRAGGGCPCPTCEQGELLVARADAALAEALKAGEGKR